MGRTLSGDNTQLHPCPSQFWLKSGLFRAKGMPLKKKQPKAWHVGQAPHLDVAELAKLFSSFAVSGLALAGYEKMTFQQGCDAIAMVHCHRLIMGTLALSPTGRLIKSEVITALVAAIAENPKDSINRTELPNRFYCKVISGGIMTLMYHYRRLSRCDDSIHFAIGKLKSDADKEMFASLFGKTIEPAPKRQLCVQISCGSDMSVDSLGVDKQLATMLEEGTDGDELSEHTHSTQGNQSKQSRRTSSIPLQSKQSRRTSSIPLQIKRSKHVLFHCQQLEVP